MANINGTLLPDVLLGTSEDDVITGGAGDDLISGFGGNDWLIGESGRDSMFGGTGNDHYLVDIHVGDLVLYVPIPGLIGIPALVLDVTALGATIQVTIGGVLEIRNVNIGTLTGSDEVGEDIGEGDDTVHTAVSFALGAGEEVETLITTNAAGTRDLVLIGNEFGQSVYGNAGNNLIDGGGGIDYMLGLAGNDLILVDRATDQVVEHAGEGDDRVASHVSYALAQGVSVETMSTMNANSTGALNLTGNEINNSLYGNNGDNFLDGGAGADYLVGLCGNDTYVVDNAGDRIAETATDCGDDTVASSVNYTLESGVHVETMRTTNASATTALNLSGNELGQSIYGNAGANILSGGGGHDYLVGNEGNDVLSGGAGSDYLLGGAGADRFVVHGPDGSNIDRILDFQTGDLIDMSGVDANAVSGGHQAFAFIGGSQFGNVAGQLRAVQNDQGMLVEADLDGDGTADFQLQLVGTTQLGSSDFLF